jgi:hypothetical protein
MVTVLSAWLYKEEITKYKVISLIVSSVGLILVVGVVFDGLNFLGVFCGSMSAVVYSFYLLLGNRVAGKISPFIITTYVLTVAAVVFNAVGWTTGSITLHISKQGWLAIVGLAVVSTVIAILTLFLGMRTVGPARTAIISTVEPVVTARFMSVLAQMIDAGAVQKNKSMFAGKTGQMVASSVLNLVDDGLSAAGMPFPFDGEGVPVSRKTIIDQGILKSFLYDTYTANRAGIQSTGNAQRASFRSLPTVGTTNFMILPGTSDPAALLQDMEEGLYITDVMGMHTANPISGDFSVGAAGIMVKKGRLAFPVRGITIAGNLGQMLHDIEAVGNDQRFFGSRGAPTLRLKSLSIGGE